MPLFTMKNCDFDQSKFFNEFYFLVFAINLKKRVRQTKYYVMKNQNLSIFYK